MVVDCEIAMPRLNIGLVGSDHLHDAISGVREYLTVTAFIHVSVIISPIDRNGAGQSFDGGIFRLLG